MGEKQRVSGSAQIDASPQHVYDLVTDLPRMAEWSPENTGGSWQGGARAAAPGVKFKGKNQNGKKSWSSAVVVTDATAPSRFAFSTVVGPMVLAEWIYEIEPTGAGCTVTETWVDTRNPLIAKMGKTVTGVGDRASHTRSMIDATLANIKKAAESSS